MSSRFRTPIVAMALALVVVIFDVAARAQEGRRDAREIAPEALIGTWGFGDSALNFELRVWTTNGGEILRISTELYTAVHKALREAGIVIPFPQRDVHMIPPSNPDPGTEATAPSSE